MTVQTLAIKGKGINVRIYFDKGLLDYIEISTAKEIKKMRETIKISTLPGRTLDTNRLHNLIIIEHGYQKLENETYTEVFAERYSIEDYTQNILRVFNDQIGVKYRDKIIAGDLSFDDAKEYIEKFLHYIDVIHTQRRFHGLFEIVKESLNDVYDFFLFS